MSSYSINVCEPWFGHILSGEKIVEGRLCKGKFVDIHIGDKVCINGIVIFKVSRKTIYKSFLDMLTTEGLANVLIALSKA